MYISEQLAEFSQTEGIYAPCTEVKKQNISGTVLGSFKHTILIILTQTFWTLRNTAGLLSTKTVKMERARTFIFEDDKDRRWGQQMVALLLGSWNREGQLIHQLACWIWKAELISSQHLMRGPDDSMGEKSMDPRSRPPVYQPLKQMRFQSKDREVPWM